MGLDKRIELMNLNSQFSLAKRPFKKMVKLSDSEIPILEVPPRFKDKSFTPQNGLDLHRLSKTISSDLGGFDVDRQYIRQVTSGVCEGVKNAYEHGNKEDNTKNILFSKCYDEGKAEFLIGDSGGEMRGEFVPFVLLFRQKGHEKLLTDVPDFYNFSGELYAPQGHSGVGTKTMHLCFDEVSYFRSSIGGLLVYLSKNLPEVSKKK